MLFGLVLLLATSLILCFSASIPMLLVGRIFQGMSAAIVWSVGLALVVDTVDSQHIGQAMGWIGSATSLGTLIAPLLGGLVYSKAGYYPVFAMCFALILLDMALRLLIIETKDAKQWLTPEEEDRETESLIPALDSTETNMVQEDQLDARLPAEADQSERDISPSPMSLVGLISKPRLASALFGTVVESSIQTCFDSTLPLFVSSTFGWDATGAGLIFLPLILPTLLGPVVGDLSDRYGAKWFATFGFLMATPLLVCLRFVTDDTITHEVMLCVILSGIGLSTTFIFGPLMAEITWSIQEDSDDSTMVPYALAYGLHTMSFSTGAILGPVAGGVLLDNFGWSSMGLALGLLNLVAAAVQIIWTGGTLRLYPRQAV